MEEKPVGNNPIEAFEKLAKNDEFLKAVAPLIHDELLYDEAQEKFFDNVRKKEDRCMYDKLETLKFKINSIKYHLARIKEEEENGKDKIKKLQELTLRNRGINEPIKKGIAVMNTGIDFPRVRIEFESFIFQVKSFLEIFVQVVSSKFKNDTYKISKLKNILSDFIDKDKKAKLILDIINKANWLDDFESKEGYKTMRDIATHKKQLTISPQQLILTSEGCEQIKSGTIHRGKQLKHIDYASSIFPEIESFAIDILKILYEIE